MEMLTKKEIRKEVKSKRQSTSNAHIQDMSQKIAQTLFSMEAYKQAEWIFVYVDCKNEVRTKDIITHSWELQKKVAVPKVIGEEMQFFKLNSFDELSEGYYGIREPKTEGKEYEIHPDGLMILPGVGFDESRHRVGYGGGFYDRYLKKYPKMGKIALAFEFQIFPQVPWEIFDISPNNVVTEKRII